MGAAVGTTMSLVTCSGSDILPKDRYFISYKYVELLRKSWIDVEEIGVESIGMSMFKVLFVNCPETFTMFGFSQEPDWQNGKHFKHHCKVFMNVIGSAIKTADKPELLTYHIEFLGSRHVGGGITEHHFKELHNIFLDSLQEHLKEMWSQELSDAWSEIYNAMAKILLESMNRKV
jgi:hemoglobin-like flavoprotein